MWRLRAAYFFGASPDALARQYGYVPTPAPAPTGGPTAAVAILAKAPVAGLAKTRLIPLLGAAGAARAQRRFARRTLVTALAAAPGAVTLWCAPDPAHRFFRAVQRSTGAACWPQPDGDLGLRMGRVFDHHFAQQPHTPLLLVGTDCPVLTPAHLQQAAQALATHDVVLIPAEDGGYVLIGMRRSVPPAFEGVAWSTPQVLAQTRAQLRLAGASWLELAPLWDVDEPPDWQRLQALLHPPD
ncbi:MAG: TIGR04282 family arsenosugar biosynthesis glycosyltransferase [Burkholderiales bacterium]|nr:TIGR04282 family arsenosugar biosynthesis glycosyltransferase [Burkholderiales bacterium]